MNSIHSCRHSILEGLDYLDVLTKPKSISVVSTPFFRIVFYMTSTAVVDP